MARFSKFYGGSEWSCTTNHADGSYRVTQPPKTPLDVGCQRLAEIGAHPQARYVKKHFPVDETDVN